MAERWSGVARMLKMKVKSKSEVLIWTHLLLFVVWNHFLLNLQLEAELLHLNLTKKVQKIAWKNSDASNTTHQASFQVSMKSLISSVTGTPAGTQETKRIGTCRS